MTQEIRIALLGLSAALLCTLALGAWQFNWMRLRARLDHERLRVLEVCNRELHDIAAANDASPVALVVVTAGDPGQLITYANAAFARSTGIAVNALLGCSYWDLVGAASAQKGAQSIRRLIESHAVGQAVIIHHYRHGGPVWYNVHVAPLPNSSTPEAAADLCQPTPTDPRCVLVHYDISEARRYQAELERDASHDALTGLANRSLLRRRLREGMAQADASNQQIWVVFLDLDRFKAINDSLGHKAGDHLLQILSGRLSQIVRDTDTVARLGGDEFVIIMRETEHHTISMAAVKRVLEAVAEPMAIEGHQLVLTCSIGIAVYPTNGKDPEHLVECADVAMYSAKQRGRNNFQFYDAALNERALSRLVMESALRTAVERQEFCLNYQPQVDLKNGYIVGMEALIHWRHPTLGIVPPTDFIGLAEESGLIVEIGQWVLREACLQNKAWQDAGLGFLRVAVNLSPRQFADPHLVQSIDAILRETGLAPQYLEIELTENLIMMEITRAVEILMQLKANGIQLSIDDFGTGYSSLSYLKQFPIDVLKIDRTFVKDIGSSADDEAIVKSIITLAHALKLHVIAEGVETAEQLAFLAQHDCDEFQGFYFSRPLAPAVFGRLLREQQPIHAMPQLLH